MHHPLGLALRSTRSASSSSSSSCCCCCCCAANRCESWGGHIEQCSHVSSQQRTTATHVSPAAAHALHCFLVGLAERTLVGGNIGVPEAVPVVWIGWIRAERRLVCVAHNTNRRKSDSRAGVAQRQPHSRRRTLSAQHHQHQHRQQQHHIAVALGTSASAGASISSSTTTTTTSLRANTAETKPYLEPTNCLPRSFCCRQCGRHLRW